MQAYDDALLSEESLDAFDAARAAFDGLTATLASAEAGGWTHDQVEEQLECNGREVLRLLFQAHPDLRAVREQHQLAQDRIGPVTDAGGTAHRNVEPGHLRRLATVFGTVRVTRCAWRADGARNLYPADAALNLPSGCTRTGCSAERRPRRCAAPSMPPMPRSPSVAATWPANGRSSSSPWRPPPTSTPSTSRWRRSRPPTRRCWWQAWTARAWSCAPRRCGPRPARPPPQRAQAATGPGWPAGEAGPQADGDPGGRLRRRPRAATAPRCPGPAITLHADDGGGARRRRAGPVASAKWLTGSIAATSEQVVASVFDQAEQRDPTHRRTWVVLVDGARHQLELLRAEAARRQVPIHILVDLIHVLEYLWRAAWRLFPDGDPAAEPWVATHAVRILAGDIDAVITALGQQASAAELTAQQRGGIDTCIGYLTAKKPFLGYQVALSAAGRSPPV
jgi:hypothetical protein